MTSQETPSAVRPATPGSPELPAGTADEQPLLQERLALFGAISFALGAAFYAVAQAMVALGREAPWPAVAHAAMLANVGASACTWAWCRGGRRSASLLRVLDGIVTLVVGQTALAVAVVVIPEADLARMVILLAITLALYSRAIFVPSSASRTALVSVLTAAPLAVYSILTEPLRLSVWKVVWLLAAVVVATAGSAVIYGLRREVRRARRLGQYTLEGKLGEGGMGVVYRARHAMLRRPTAVKLLRPERAGEAALRRFEREVQLTASLAHPNTVAVFDFGRTPDGVFYYAMEYLAGLTLEEVVSGDGPQPGPRVAHVLRQILGSLAEAHSVGLIHRDVKPSNVILCERGGLSDVVKVLDFGLARELASAEGLSQTGTLVGTPSYLAPEAIRAAAPDPRSDLYAVGAVGYLLLTGQPVFEGRTVVEVCGHHLHTAPVPPSERLGRPVPAPLESFILSCLAKDPDDRPQTAEAATAALEGVDDPPWAPADARAWWASTGRALVSARRVDELAARGHALEARRTRVRRHVTSAGDDARTIFDYLVPRDTDPTAADAVIGFGHFDMKIPRRCLELYRQGRAPLIVLSGGLGAGTADLGRPEARAFLEEIETQGGAPDADILFEDASTNTGENVEATTRLLAQAGRPFGTDGGVRSALIVANACRQRRVFLTCRRHHPAVRWINAPPETSFEDERALYAEKGQDLVVHLTGEIRRLLEYPRKGYCLPADIPAAVLAAQESLEALIGS